MKKIIIIVLILVIGVIIGSCKGFVDEGVVGKQKCEELLQYLNDNDAKGLILISF